jgi:hypothetical protein
MHLATVLKHSEGGANPAEQELQAEAQALYKLATVRRDLLDALAALNPRSN